MNSLRLSRTSGLRAFVAVVALTLGAGAGLAAWAGPHDGGYGGPMMGGSPRMVDHMLSDVGATDAQRAQVKQIVQAAAADLKAQRDAARSLRDQQMALFTQPTVDANAVEQLRLQMLTQHDLMSKRMSQAMIDVARVLTPDQRVKIAERMKARGDMWRRHHEERMQLEQKG